MSAGFLVAALLLIPLLAALLLAMLPGYRLSARLNVGASAATLAAALLLFGTGFHQRPLRLPATNHPS